MMGLAHNLMRAVDWSRASVVDAANWLPDAWRRDKRTRVRAVSDERPSSPFVVQLEASECLEVSLPPLGDDLQEVERAFRLQADQLSPLPLEEIAYGFARAAGEDWVAVIVRRQTLADIRDRFDGTSAQIAGFEYKSANGPVLILDDPARQSRRREFLTLSGLSLALILLISGLATALDARADRTLQHLQSVQSERTTQLRTLVERQSLLEAQLQARGLPLSDMAAGYRFIAQTQPTNWLLERLEIDRARTRAVYRLAPTHESAVEPLLLQWRENFEGHEITLERGVDRAGNILVTLSADRREG